MCKSLLRLAEELMICAELLMTCFKFGLALAGTAKGRSGFSKELCLPLKCPWPGRRELRNGRANAAFTSHTAGPYPLSRSALGQ